jgi:Ca-activated chloride channel family protein
VQARGSTALHEGWLTGCNAIAADGPTTARLTRCFLLTDGLANVGVTDSERIASDAAGVQANAGVGTSTFGIGLDYNEGLLGPMAVAGGGQFHHLRGPAEIATTFLGELGELLTVAVRDVRLEIEGAPGTTAEIVSPYWMQQATASGWSWSVTLGDLLAGEFRQVVVRFGFTNTNELDHSGPRVRARLAWLGRDGQRVTAAWREINFEYAEYDARRAERVDPDVQRVVGVHHAERAQRVAIEQARKGDVAAAREVLGKVARRISEYASDDPQLQQSIAGLRRLETDISERGYAPAPAKEAYYASQTRSRGQRDLRAP